MAFSDLHSRFIDFAAGMPAVAVSEDIIRLEVGALARSLSGQYPDKPSPLCGNIPMPVYNLAFSVFVDNLSYNYTGGVAELTVRLRATIHPRGKPRDIIREYLVETNPPMQLVLENEASTRTLYWRENGLSTPSITPSWGADYQLILAGTSIEEPKEQNFIDKVEIPSLWSTKNTFVNLVVSTLPRINLAEMVPWITFLDPILVDYQGHHLIITASRAMMEVGGCTPKMVPIEPDNDFPYGEYIPPSNLDVPWIDYAVYLPKTRLINFVADTIQPAVLVNSGPRGGLIKWQLAGSIGIKRFSADISSHLDVGDPSLKGVIGIGADIDFVGAGRAWLDGPSGSKIGLASASVIGSGEFGALIRLEVNLAGGFISAELVVEKSELTSVDFDLNTPLPWPIDEIASEILDHVAKNEVRKLTQHVVKLGRWEFLLLPNSYLELSPDIPGFNPAPVAEGLSEVSTIVGIARNSDVDTDSG